eukprot:TRINITY_DN19172_c0_g1_i1.p1 TRINITY_DN19172_c0_g1~~TRINITY_DN19172_c0_g1_i1.p1  ORF type:complete len:722 (+),score=97.42 TRINITY_DN19172_c0_g1_i1:39-2204(+)
MFGDAGRHLSPRRRPVVSNRTAAGTDYARLSSFIDQQFQTLDNSYGVKQPTTSRRWQSNHHQQNNQPSPRYITAMSLGDVAVSPKGKGDYPEADYLSPRGQFNTQELEERSPTIPVRRSLSPVQSPPLASYTEATPAVRVFEGYLSGPNICGSPIEISIAEAKEIALNNPDIKGFCFQNVSPVTGLSWVYFKPSYNFCPAQGWTAVHIVSHIQGARSPRSRPYIATSPISNQHNTNRDASFFRDRLLRFYHYYCPEKLPNAISTLNDYRGMEQSLFDSLVRMYGPEPDTPGLDEHLPEGWICVENRSGHVFYVHAETGRKQWQKPGSHTATIVPPEIAGSPVRKQPSIGPSLNKAVLITLSGGHLLQSRFSALLGEFGFRQQVALSEKVPGSTPTHSNLMKAFDWLCRDAVPESKLVVYYCGSVTDHGLLTSDDKVLRAQQITEIFSGMSRLTQLLLFLDVAPGGTVIDLEHQNLCNSRGIKTLTIPVPHTISPCTTVITVTDGFPPVGALTSGFCNVVRSSPRNIFFRTLLGQIRDDSLSGMQCSISLCTNRDANCFSFMNFNGHQVQETQSPPPIVTRSKSDFGFTEKDKQDILSMAAADAPPILRAVTPLRPAGSPRQERQPSRSPTALSLREHLSPFRDSSPVPVTPQTLPPYNHDTRLYTPVRRFNTVADTPSMSPDRQKKAEHLQQLQNVVSSLESGGQRADDVLREVLELLGAK